MELLQEQDCLRRRWKHATPNVTVKSLDKFNNDNEQLLLILQMGKLQIYVSWSYTH